MQYMLIIDSDQHNSSLYGYSGIQIPLLLFNSTRPLLSNTSWLLSLCPREFVYWVKIQIKQIMYQKLVGAKICLSHEPFSSTSFQIYKRF